MDAIVDYAVLTLDRRGYVTSWNRGAERLKGWHADEILGRHFSILYPPDERASERLSAVLETAARLGRIEDEGWRVRKDGSSFWGNVVISAVHDDHGELRGFAKVTRDLTTRRSVEESLAVRARQQAAVAELGIYALKTNDLQAVMNRSVQVVATMLETELTKVLELEATGELRLCAGIGWREELLGRARVGAGLDSQAGYTLSSREPVIVHDLRAESRFSGPPLLHEHGVVSGLSVIIHGGDGALAWGVFGAHTRRRRTFSQDDVSFVQSVANVLASAIGRRRAEEQLRAAEREAAQQRLQVAKTEAAIKARDEFLSIASHELRTPLTALVLQLQGLDRTLGRGAIHGRPMEDLLAPHLGKALKYTNRLTGLIERLLDVSRIHAGKLTNEHARVDVARLVEELVDDFAEQARTASCELRLTVGARPLAVWDRLRIEQVLNNLLSNAIKYGPGKPIEVEVRSESDRVWITVRDHGIGIALQDLDRVFERFERAVSLQHYGGLGLGLYISRHIVESHGGVIRVSSLPGEGSAFEVELPLEAALSF